MTNKKDNPSHIGLSFFLTINEVIVQMIDFAPGMRVIIRDEEWMIKKAEKNTMGVYALLCTGISSLVKDRNAVFMADIDEIIPVDPTKIKLVVDESPKYRDTLLYLESQWRKRTPTDKAKRKILVDS